VLKGIPGAVLEERDPLFTRIKHAAMEKAPEIAAQKAGEAVAAFLASAAASG